MEIKFDVLFTCPDNIKPYLQKVFDGEYDAPIFMHSPKILDLGANCGSFSLWASHRFPGCTIEAYEPHPETFKFLAANTKRYPNVKIHNYGIGTPGLRVLCNGMHNSGEASFHAPNDNPTPTGQHIEVHDPLELPEADMIKLDIEGCEFEVLEPLIKAGRKFDVIMLEWHNHTLRGQIEDLLRPEYYLIGADVQSMFGRGVSKWMRKELVPGAV